MEKQHLPPSHAAPELLPDSSSHARRILEEGWTVVEDAIEPELVALLRDTIRMLETKLDLPTSNPGIEGQNTRRLYNLLAKDPVFRTMPTHPAVLPIAEAVLNDDCLLSGMTAIDLGPGERAQTFHSDDMAMDDVLLRPHSPMSVTCIWALTPFTASNGATRFVPGSHRWTWGTRAPDRPTDVAWRTFEMSAGSVVIFHGSLWHGGGANSTSTEWRLGAWVQYCHGFIRQQQNPYVGIPLEVVESFSDRMRELVGYRTYRGVMGHVDGREPDAAAFSEPDDD